MGDVAADALVDREELLAADRRKDEFLATLAHELRNALAPLRTAVDLVKLVGHEPTTRVHAVGILDRQLDHMTRLVDDLLDVSRISRGQLELQPEPADLVAVVERAVEATRRVVEGHGHRLEAHYPSQRLAVMVDPVRITQVVSNLLDNAAKFTPPGGRVQVAVRREDGEAVVTVCDTGIGIPAEQLRTVFEMFAQGERPTSRVGGLGIGLALARRLVELHGGSVVATSPGAGAGTEVIVRLPLALIAAPRY